VSQDNKTSTLPDLFNDTSSAGESHGKMNDKDELGRAWKETVRISMARYFRVFENPLGNVYEGNENFKDNFGLKT
jgi:hypothetical protein